MITIPRPGDTSQTAVFIRVAALLMAVASMIVIPWSFFAAVTQYVSVQTALTTSAIFGALTILVVLAARSLDPLRS